MVLYIIWVNKNSYFLILNKSEGSVVKNNDIICEMYSYFPTVFKDGKIKIKKASEGLYKITLE